MRRKDPSVALSMFGLGLALCVAGMYHVRLDGYAGAGSDQAPYRLLVQRAGA